MKLLVFEWKKLFFTKRFTYTLLILAAVISGLFIPNLAFEELMVEEQEKQVTTWTQEVQSLLREVNKQVEVDPDNTKSLEQLKLLSAALQGLYEWRPLLSSEDWQTRLKSENTFLTAILSFKEIEGEFSLLRSEMTHTIALNEELLARSIPPEFEQYSTAVPNFLYRLTELFVNGGAILLLVILAGDLLTNEFEQRSIQFLLMQPMKKTSILHAKGISMLLFYLLITIVTLGLAWLIPTLFGKPGRWDYPIQSLQDPTHFLSIDAFLAQSLIATSVTVMAVIAILLIVSMLVKHSVATLLITLIVFICGYFLFTPLTGTFHPFAYVFAGQTIRESGQLDLLPLVLCGVLSIVIYGVAVVRMKKVT